jgi:hypothetical protein
MFGSSHGAIRPAEQEIEWNADRRPMLAGSSAHTAHCLFAPGPHQEDDTHDHEHRGDLNHPNLVAHEVMVPGSKQSEVRAHVLRPSASSGRKETETIPGKHSSGLGQKPAKKMKEER